MSSLKRWRAIGGGGDFHKWTTPGEALEGIWRGLHDGQYGPVGTLETPEGLVRFAVTTALVERLQAIPEGTGLKVQTAMLEVASRYRVLTSEQLLDAVIRAVDGVKAADREKAKAATIGTAVHAAIEWHLRTQRGEDAGPAPRLSEAAQWAVEAWKDWARSVALEPLAIERVVTCRACGYAGTLDFYARVGGVPTILLDWRSGRAIYAEAFLQNVAYRHAAAGLGLPSSQGCIVRLPKTVDDPAFEVQWVPDTIVLDDFLAALRLWRWQRQMAGWPTGDPGVGRHDAQNSHESTHGGPR
jgi:hypothetical protein